jgi:hypothetical protein
MYIFTLPQVRRRHYQPDRRGPPPRDCLRGHPRVQEEDGVRVGRGVAVVGCSWHQSIAEVEAVRMVPLGRWQWQYWPRYGCFYVM